MYDLFFRSDCEWRGVEAKLVLHHEDGFTLLATHEGAGSGRGRVLWSQAFHKLVMSSDDGTRLIWLRFDGDMEVVSVCVRVCVYACACMCVCGGVV